MREVRIFHESEGQPKRMIGALWVRGDIEISKDGVLASCATKSAATGWGYHRDGAQLCMTLPGKISYVMAAEERPAAQPIIECSFACNNSLCQLVGWHTKECLERAALSEPATGAAREAKDK